MKQDMLKINFWQYAYALKKLQIKKENISAQKIFLIAKQTEKWVYEIA